MHRTGNSLLPCGLIKFPNRATKELLGLPLKMDVCRALSTLPLIGTEVWFVGTEISVSKKSLSHCIVRIRNALHSYWRFEFEENQSYCPDEDPISFINLYFKDELITNEF
mmetsp:Transcript_12189/g.22848  ORF Transcript_12189/g.22848 Transcript_12189/m.22848 type:complete len:110 (+) Transcript_12189:4447-4776(+)